MLRQLIALSALPFVTAAVPTEDYAEPYRILQRANQTLDAFLAASAYATEGVLIFEAPDRTAETFRGIDTIRAAYVRTFRQVDAGTAIKLEFRFAPPGPGPYLHSGAYRAELTSGGRDITSHGRFSATLVKQDGKWRFGEDRGTIATAEDFEELPVSKPFPPSKQGANR